MKKGILYIVVVLVANAFVLTGCNRPSKAEQYRAAKHVKDSVALEDQLRTLAYYEAQQQSLMPVADSLLKLFTYEKNERYQDNGYYVAKGKTGLRVMVRDDGKDLLIYRNAKRFQPEDITASQEQETLTRAQYLQIVINDIKELDKRIHRTSLEVEKYKNRLEKH